MIKILSFHRIIQVLQLFLMLDDADYTPYFRLETCILQKGKNT